MPSTILRGHHVRDLDLGDEVLRLPVLYLVLAPPMHADDNPSADALCTVVSRMSESILFLFQDSVL